MHEGWSESPLSDVVELGKGGVWGKDVEDVGLTPAICLRGTDLAELIDQRIPNAPLRWVTSSELAKSRCAPDMVLIETSGSRCGRSIVLTSGMLAKFGYPVVYSNFCRTLKIDTKKVSTQYIELWFSHNYANGLIPSYRATSAMPNLDIKSLLRIELLRFPSLTEQRRIVALVSSVDAYIESLQQQVDAARTARNAVLHDLLSASGDDWTETPLGDVLEIVRGGSPRPIDAFLTNDATGVNWIKIGDASASSKYIYTTGQKIRQEGVSRSRLVKEGDFILSNSMSFGRPYIMRTTGCIHDGWLLLSKIHVTFDEDYLYNVLLSQDVQSQFESLAAGSGVRNLNIDVVKQVRVPVPPRAHQERIASTANGFDEYVRAAEDALEEARGLRSGLLADLLSGEHEIPESYDRFLGAA